MIRPPSDAALREYIYSFIEWPKVLSILDVGCGNGHDLREIARLAPENIRFYGIDTSVEAINEARRESAYNERFEFSVADVSATLPFSDGAFDLVFSKNLLECIADKSTHLADIHRVLRPGGQVICAHYDWDSQLIDGEDKDLVRRIITTFGDWKQAWMTDCDAWMGRRLWRTFQSTGLFQGNVQARVLTETEFAPGAYGWEMVNSFRALVRREMVSEADFGHFYSSIKQLSERSEYIYSIVMFVYSGHALTSRGDVV